MLTNKKCFEFPNYYINSFDFVFMLMNIFKKFLNIYIFFLTVILWIEFIVNNLLLDC